MIKKALTLAATLLLISLFFTAVRAQSVSQTLAIKAGFNFVSFELRSFLSPQKLKELNPKIDDIYAFSSAAGSFISASEGTLSSIGPGKGYIVKANTDGYLNTSGDPAGTIGDITLRTGFNLIGISKQVETMSFGALMAKYPVITGMYKWSASSGSFIQVVRDASQVPQKLDGIDPSVSKDQAYFISVSADTTINYDGSSILVGQSGPPPVTAKMLGFLVVSTPRMACQTGATLTFSSLGPTAVYSDGTTQAVTPSWTVKSGGGSISQGVYTAPAAAATVTLTASYSESGVTKTCDVTVSVLAQSARPRIISSLVLSKSSDQTGLSTQYDLSAITATVAYSDGTSKAVAPSWDLLIGSGPMQNGKYTASSSPESIVIRAFFDENGYSAWTLFKLTVASGAVSGGNFTTSPYAGTVKLPAGASVTASALTVLTNYSEAPVTAAGAFSATVSSTSSTVRSAIFVNNSSDRPVLMKTLFSGTQADGDGSVSATTTADSLVLFDPFFLSLDAASLQSARTALASHPDRVSLIAMIESAIVSDPSDPLEETRHRDIYLKAAAISSSIASQIAPTQAASPSSGAPGINAAGELPAKLVYVADDPEHNTPYVDIVNTSFCYFNAVATNGGQKLAVDGTTVISLPRRELTPQLKSVWPPTFLAGTATTLYAADGDLSFAFTKDREKTVAYLIASTVSLLAGGLDFADPKKLGDYVIALKTSSGVTADIFNKYILNPPAMPSNATEWAALSIGFAKDGFSIAFELIKTIVGEEYLIQQGISRKFLTAASAAIVRKLNAAYTVASLAYSMADASCTMYSLYKSETTYSESGKQLNGWYPKTATDPLVYKIDIGGGTILELIRIEAGTFAMGSPDTETGRSADEGPAHSVTISKPFFIGRYEITQKQWATIMTDNPAPSDPNYGTGDNYPVHNISSDDCYLFISRLNAKKLATGIFKLPTEAQWEYACRAGSATPFYFEYVLNESYCWGKDNSKSSSGVPMLHPVGQKLPNAWGLYDMSGSVSEYCSDWYNSKTYTTDAVTDPTGATGPDPVYNSKVLRGGNFNLTTAWNARSANREFNFGVTQKSFACGLRVVLQPAQ